MDNRREPDDWTIDRSEAVQALKISLLGPVRISSASGEDRTPPSKRGQALVAMVALSERGERTRGWLQTHLWSDRPPEQASASLRQELAKLRRLVGPEHLVAEGDRILLRNVEVDVLDLYHAGAIACSFLAAETPQLLEGLAIADRAFEQWVARERESWQARLGGIAGTPSGVRWDGAGPHRAAPALPAAPRPPAPDPAAERDLPTLGLLPCVVRSTRPELAALGDLTCDLLVKTMVENRTAAVFDFRDLSPDFVDGSAAMLGKPVRGPDLLATLRLLEVGGMIEIAVAVRRVENGRLVFTQSFSADATDPGLFGTEKVAEFVTQTVDAIETFLLTDSGDDVRSASRLILAAAHRIFCIKPTDLDVAERQLHESFALDPSAVQLAWLAMLECVREGETAQATDATERAVRRERVADLTARALELDRGNSLALALLGHANSYVLRDYDFAAELVTDALAINRYRAVTWATKAMLHVYTGDPEAGYGAALQGRSLGRTSPYAFWYNATCGISAALTGRHHDAVRFGRLVTRQRPDFKPILRHVFASEAALGDVEAASRTLAQLRKLEPDFSPANLDRAIYPVPSQNSIDLIRSGLAAAGGQLIEKSSTDL